MHLIFITNWSEALVFVVALESKVCMVTDFSKHVFICCDLSKKFLCANDYIVKAYLTGEPFFFGVTFGTRGNVLNIVVQLFNGILSSQNGHYGNGSSICLCIGEKLDSKFVLLR